MWKTDFTLKIDAHPEEGLQTVDVHQGVEYWHIHGLDINTVLLPKDDNVLGQIIEVCQAIIDHEDNPLNTACRTKV